MAKRKDERVRSTPPPLTPPRNKRRDDQDNDDDPPRSRRREPSSSGAGMPLLFIGGGVAAVVLLLLACLVPVFFFMLRSKPAEVAPPIAEVNPAQQPPDAGPIKENPFPQNPLPNDPPRKDPFKKETPPVNPVPKAAVWNAHPDPGPDMTRPPASPAAFWALTGNPEIIYPSSPSPFVAIRQGPFGKESWSVVNLQTGQLVSTINGKLDFGNNDIALSPDGKMLAGQGKFQPNNATVLVVSCTDGRTVQSITVENKAAALVAVDFGENGHLITYKTRGVTGICEVFNIATGASVKQFTRQGLVNRKNNLAFSPGRKYLAVAENSMIDIYRPLTGERVGALRMPDVLGMFKAVAFSSDGTEIAVLSENFGSSSRLFSWKMADGKTGVEHKFAKDVHTLVKNAFGYKGAILEWVPDNSGWLLYGQLWVDYQSGAPVHTIAYPANEFRYWPRRMIGTAHVATAVGDFQKQQMNILTLPGAEIAAAVKAARAGGGPVAALPGPKVGDLAFARNLPAPAGDAPWAAQPDPAPPVKARPGAQPIPLRGNAKDILKILFTAGDVGQAVVVSGLTPNALDGRKQFRADRFDLIDGKALGGFELFSTNGAKQGPAFPNIQPQPWKADVSPDGARLLVRHPDDPKRLDVWNLSDGKHLAAWSVFDSVDALVMVDADRALTSAGGKVILWKLPECQAIYVANGYRGALALSPGRKQVAVSTGSALCLLDVATGERKGQFAAPGGQAGAFLSGGFSRDGKEFVAALGNVVAPGSSGTKLAHWNVANGAWLGSCNGNGGEQPILVLGKYALSGNQLFDWNFKAAFWQYSLPGLGAYGAGSPDARHWFATDAQNVATLHVQTVPDNTALAFANLIASGNVKPVVTPGTPLQIQVNGGNEKFRANAQNASKHWEAFGFKSGPGGLTATLSAVEQPTGQAISYEIRKLGAIGKGQMVKINERKVVCSCIITDLQGAVLHRNDATFTFPAGINNVEGKDYERQLVDAMWRSAEGFASFVPLPVNQYRVNGKLETLPKIGQLQGGG